MSEFAKIIKQCEKEWACPELMTSVFEHSGKKIPLSSPSLNWATYGGIPRAALTVFYGVPGGGKTSSAIDVCRNAYKIFEEEYAQEVAELQESVAKGKKEAKVQLMDLQDRGSKKILYVDLEHTFDKRWAGKLNVTIKTDMDDTDGMIYVMEPPNITAESLLQKLREIISTGEIGLIVLDSIPSLVTKSELEKDLDAEKQAFASSLAGLMTKFCRLITQLLTRYDCTMIFINQLRTNIENPYTDNTPGGDAIKFYSSLIMRFNVKCPVDFVGNELKQSVENPAGYIIEATIKKQKSASFDRKLGSYYLMIQSGLRVDFEFAKLAINKYEIIQKHGGWYYMYDPYTKEPLEENGEAVKVNGIIKVYDYLQINTEYYDTICKFILEDINKPVADMVGETVDE